MEKVTAKTRVELRNDCVLLPIISLHYSAAPLRNHIQIAILLVFILRT